MARDDGRHGPGRPAGSDAERQAAVDALRQHTADGRLTLDEFEERADEAYRARALGELARVGRNLPTRPTTALEPAPPLDPRIEATLGEKQRRGRWHVPDRVELSGSSYLGSKKLRGGQTATSDAPAVHVHAIAILGDVAIDVQTPSEKVQGWVKRLAR